MATGSLWHEVAKQLLKLALVDTYIMGDETLEDQ